MGEKLVKKSRKVWLCEYCQLPIPIGSSYIAISYRAPRCDDSGRQIGIEYVQVQLHADVNLCNKHLVAIGAIDQAEVDAISGTDTNKS